jgi:hypothetical protein
MSKTKLAVIVQATGVAALLAVGIAFGAPATATKLQAHLTNAQEVPKVTTKGGTGTFTGTLTRTKTGGKLKWRLTYKGLSGPATQAHIHKGVKGTSGAILIALCGGTPKCKSPLTGTSTVTKAEITLMLKGKTYVNVHTAKNPGGEIRGQLRKV